MNENGTIIDGHHRQMIANSLGIDCPREVRTGLTEAGKRLLAMELNMARRQLTDAQKVLLAEQMKPDVAAEAEARKKAAQFGGAGGTQMSSTGGESKTERSTLHKLAQSVGYSSRSTLGKDMKLMDQLRAEPDGDQLVKHVESRAGGFSTCRTFEDSPCPRLIHMGADF